MDVVEQEQRAGTGVDVARLQRAPQGAGQSTGGSGDDVVEGGGVVGVLSQGCAVVFADVRLGMGWLRTIRAKSARIAAVLLATGAVGACGGAVTAGPTPSIAPPAAATLTFSPTSVDFLTQLRGQGSSGILVVVHIANPASSVPVAIGALSIQPVGQVTISNDGCSNQTLAPGASCSVRLAYPTRTALLGRFVGTLLVPNNLKPGQIDTLSLKGNLEHM